jgi:hypothetical protein
LERRRGWYHRPTSTSWQTYSFTVIGSGGLDRLEFREPFGDNSGAGGLIDDVSLVAAPIPVQDDALHGGDGDDTLHSGSGNDLLYDGNGSDLFLFGRNDGGDQVDGGAAGGWIDAIRLSGVTHSFARTRRGPTGRCR